MSRTRDCSAAVKLRLVTDGWARFLGRWELDRVFVCGAITPELTVACYAEVAGTVAGQKKDRA